VPDINPRYKSNAFGRHQIHASLHDHFFEFHVRNAVHQQPAGTIGTLKNSDLMTSAV